MTQTSASDEKIPFWRDERFWRIALQIMAVVVVVVIFSLLVGNLNRSLQQQGRQFDFSFLFNEAGFNIGESVIPYTPNDRYYWAFVVGLVNTLRLILVGFVLTTLLGTIAGVASFSENWLVRKISLVYVELVRNVPLLLQLFIWYFGIFYTLSRSSGTGANPPPNQLFGAVFINRKGIVIPWPPNTAVSWISLILLIGATVVAIVLWRWRIKLMEEQGASGKPQLMALLALGMVALLLLTFGLGWQFPQLTESNDIEGGLRMSLEYAAVLGGLVFYTGAFIAEIVRAGIQAVSKGQWEAARALGLQPGLVMRLVVLPQALRVIIPSLNSQYMNLAKNSSLALAIGYPDIFSSAATTLNQAGRSVEVILIIAATYLIINLIISVVMNTLNQTVQLKER
ncbi:MAG: ABC transporter permease subunit [Cyanobacteria bacterium CRU_2_1]|nr:ABC transporter permease subunit [Cyanobacteria bacterium RU_5_0]NJR63016.1 ABC transporter permease subunit [Cyanobacteria bacterium CRU_2_1]